MITNFELLAMKERANNAIALKLTAIQVSPEDQLRLIHEIEELRAVLRKIVDFDNKSYPEIFGEAAIAIAREVLGDSAPVSREPD